MSTGLVVAPELDIVKVSRRGILTVPAEDATAACFCPVGQPCRGLMPNALPLTSRTLERHVLHMADRFKARLAVRGYELVEHSLRLHGPWPSYELNRRLVDVEASMWREAQRADRNGDMHHEKMLEAVFERDAASPYSDYLLVGDFLKQAVLTEVIVESN